MGKINFTDGVVFCSLLLLLGIVIFLGIMADRFHKELKELKSNQIDAKQVMDVYQQKFTKPIIFENRADVIELNQEFNIPYDIHICMKNDEFDNYISKLIGRGFADAIKPFTEYVVDTDCVTRNRRVYARIRIVKPK